ncbi:uncharacterized protein LOC142741264 isoform X1 [Rhinoderma darwinii]|uniref:uncharacterized protein LOC142741264 isoform X1 n=1 Tax=Rhinoderma darwinii TaxID=43563 RepID=UPI003F67759E
MLASTPRVILVIYLASCIFADNCLDSIPGVYDTINKMIDTQAYFSSVPVKILNKKDVTENCDFWALLYEVEGLLENLKFIQNTTNYQSKKAVAETYKNCTEEADAELKGDVDAYLQTVHKNPIEILQQVKDSLRKLHENKGKLGSPAECATYYKENQQNNSDEPKGPQCTCPSPTTPISTSATSQTSLNNLSEFASSTNTTRYSFHANTLADDISHSYPEKPKTHQKNSQGLDSSSFVSTDMPSDSKPPTTIVDHSYAGITVQPGTYTDFPLTIPDFSLHSTEFPKDIHETSYISLNPSQTRTYHEQLNTATSNSDTEGIYESVVPSTIENPSLPTYSPVMEPDEIQETTMSEFVSHSPVFQKSLSVPSKEPVIETSSKSVSKAALTTQAVPRLSTSSNDPNVPSLNSVHTNILSSAMGLSSTEAPELVSQGEVTGDGNLDWAFSYLSSTMLTTKFSKTELSMSSHVPGAQLLLSFITPKPGLNAHKSPPQERDIAFDDRQNSFSDPNYGSNPLPIIATEQHEKEENQKHSQSNPQLIIIVMLVVVVLLFLCGFLYYRHRYWVLKRRLNIRCDLDLTRNPGSILSEERVSLPIIECDYV